jgi:DNA polymerase III alpha subunit
VEDFCRRADLRGMNRRAMESLVKAGAFDCLGKRGAILGALDRILSLAQREARLRQRGQATLFDLFGEKVPIPLPQLPLDGEDALAREKVAWEKELLGVALSENPMSSLAFAASTKAIASRDQLDPEMEGQRVSLVGQLSSVMQRLTRDQRSYITANLELLGGSVEVMVWPDALERTQGLWQEGNLLWVVGRVRVRGEELSIYCDEARLYSPERDRHEGQRVEPPGEKAPVGRRTLLISLTESAQPEQDAHLLRELLRTLLEFPGQDRVNLYISTRGRRVRLDVPIVSTRYCPELISRLEGLLGPGRIRLEERDEMGSAGNGP